MLKYSIVVPFHNEEENVTTLYDRVKLVMEQVGESFEMVFVDDGSCDRTYRLLEEIAAVDSRVLVVKLRRNFGQTSALAAGFDHAQGETAPTICSCAGSRRAAPTGLWRASPAWEFTISALPSRPTGAR
jgi:glycosyltransferase involved in cell wall biosynthesis